MKKTISILAFSAAILAAASTHAQLADYIAVNKSDEALSLQMTLDPAAYRLKTNQLLMLTPAVISEAGDTVLMPSVTLAGRNAWYQEVRNSEANPRLLRAGKRGSLDYSADVALQPWMERSRVIMLCDTMSECRCSLQRGSVPVADLDFTPQVYTQDKNTFVYVVPSDTIEKIYDLSGSANIVFKVNRTDIDWTYSSNYAELDSILRTIAAVKDNPDATVERITLTGYASPEGSYSNNVRLAKGRTEVVKNYVATHSDFPASVYSTTFVPEDWDGLRSWVMQSNIADKAALLELIDNPDIDVENRNDVLRRRFPEQYAFLLANVYPSLRHTDYRITYRIRRYYEVSEIAEVMATNPRNLSLNEFFILANSYEKGSPEYDEVFLTAARIYPDSEVANINAAFSAINQDVFKTARMFLDRVPDSPRKTYASGIIAAKEGRYDEALSLLRRAKAEGMEGADEAIARVAEAAAPKQSIRILGM